MNPAPAVRRFPSIETASRAAAQWVAAEAASRAKESGRFTIGLSGGRTPALLYRLLASAPIPWDRTHVFFCDERAVPPDDPAGNYALVSGELLEHLERPPAGCLRIAGERGAEAAARGCERAMREFFKDDPAAGLDVVLLGMGSDGHTASLFPRSPALDEASRWVVGISDPVGNPAIPRITLSLPFLNASRAAAFLVSCRGKEAALARALRGDAGLPAGRIRARRKTLWFVNEERS